MPPSMARRGNVSSEKSDRRGRGERGVSRQYLYDPEERAGRFPLDQALELIEGYSPAVAKCMCRAAALAGSFEAASQDLLTYMGLEIDARQIQRMVERVGPRMAQWHSAQAPVHSGSQRICPAPKPA